MHLISKENPLDENIDNSLRKFLGLEDDYEKSFRSFLNRAQSNVVYKISDDFFCNYIVMMLPCEKQEDKSFLIISPYTEQDFSKRDIFMAIEKYQLPPRLAERLIQYLGSVPLVADSTALSAIYSTFAETIWNSSENYTVKHISHSLSEEYIGTIPDNITDTIPEQKDIPFKIQLLESRYAAENQFIKYIAQQKQHRFLNRCCFSYLYHMTIRIINADGLLTPVIFF